MAFAFGSGGNAGAAGGGFGGFGGNTGTPAFGASAGAATTPAFGGGGAFGAKPSTPAFGSGGSGFGTGGAFGAQPQQQQPTTAGAFGGGGAFGGSPTTGGGFGAASSTGGGAFGTGGSSAFGSGVGGGGFGGFGATAAPNAAASPFAAKPAASSPFGHSSVFGGGTTTTSAFGSAGTSGFGGAGGFGAPASAAGTTPGAGGSTLFGGTSGFGAKSPSPFGGGTTASTGFGGAAQPSAFGGGGFGGTGGAFGAAVQQQPQVGTGAPPYQPTVEKDATGQSTYITISRMQAYSHKSAEELRHEDYLKLKDPAAAQAAAALNPPTAASTTGTGFGGGGAFGAAPATSSAFGSGASAFGGTQSAFGAQAPATTGTGAFGSAFGSGAANPTAATSGFGSFTTQPTSGGMFGTTTRSIGGFGAATTTSTGFGAAPTQSGFGTTTGAFGAPSAAPAAGGFGAGTSAFGSGTSAFGAAATQPAGGGFGFGAANTTGGSGAFGGSFGKTAASGGFGFGGTGTATAAPQAGGFGFGGSASNQPGASTSLFGGSSGGSTGSSFSFNSTAAKPAGSTGFGFGSAGTGGFGTGGGFGTASGGFGAATSQPPAATSSLFGGAGAPASTGFGFGSTPSAGTTGSSMFGAKTGTSLFGGTTGSGTTGSLFGGTAGGTSLFGNAGGKTPGGFGFGASAPTTTGTAGGFGFGSSFGTGTSTANGGFGGGLFGSAPQTAQSGAAPTPQPQSLVAAPDVNPYGAGAFGAGLVEQNVKAALDLPSLKPSSSSSSRLSSFAQDVGLPRGPLDTPLATRRQLLSSRYSMPVSVIREASFKGSKSRFSTITSAPSALRSTPETASAHDDEFKFSSSLFRHSVAKKLVIDKSEAGISKAPATRASVIPFSEDESGDAKRHKLLKPDAEGNFNVVFRNLANKKSFNLRLQGQESVKEARDEVKRLLRATMPANIRDIQLLWNGRMVQESLSISELRLTEGDAIDVALVEDLTESSVPVGASSGAKQRIDSKDASASKSSAPSRFMSYADFMNSAMREDEDVTLEKPLSSSCPSMKNEDYYTVPSYERLKRMTESELSAVDSFTVGCKGLGSVQWIGATDVRNLDLDELIQFEKKEVIVYKDDEHKHDLGTGLNRPAIVELLGIFPPRKTQDFEKYKERVQQRTKDIGATFIDYSPAKGIWRFRVEHFSRYGFDDEDDSDDQTDTDDVAMSVGDVIASRNDASVATGGSTKSFRAVGEEKRLTLPKPTHESALQSRPIMSADRTGILRNSVMYGSHFSSRGVVTSIQESQQVIPSHHEIVGPGKHMPHTMVTDAMFSVLEDDHDVVEEEDFPTVRPHVPTSTVFSIPAVYSLMPLGIDEETSVLPHASKSTTYQMFVHVTHQSPIAKNHVDPAMFLARSFRCSWGPNGELVNPGKLVCLTTSSRESDVGRRVAIECPIQVQVTSGTVTKDMLAVHYQCAAQSTSNEPVTPDGEHEFPSVPMFALPSDERIVSCLHKYVDFSDRVFKKYPSSRATKLSRRLWHLVHALWGQEHDVGSLQSTPFCPLAARDDPRELENLETFQMVDLRREAISRWFEDVLLTEWSTDPSGDDCSHATVLKLLCQHRIVESAQMAMECGDFRLASLLSQAASYEGSDFRTMLVDQLAQWSENGMLEYIDEDVVMIYSLLAGSVEVLTAQKADDLSWLSCLALFFWYKRGPATSLKAALTLYIDAVSKKLARGPTSDFSRHSQKADLLMELMKLYVEDTASLCSVLSPSGFAEGHDAHLNYGLNWHLHSVLRALGYQIDRKWESHLHHNFIRQLESNGQWEEALYVSLNISDADEREATCRQIIMRNVDMFASVDSTTLCAKYRIPVEWIEEALAVNAVAKHDHRQEIAHWIAAGSYTEAHECLVRFVAPVCLFAGEKDLLSQMLLDLEPVAADISQWTHTCGDGVIGGGLWLEYLRLESQDGLESGLEEEFLARLVELAGKLAHTKIAQPHSGLRENERLVARTALSSMLVNLSTQSVQLRALLDTTTSSSPTSVAHAEATEETPYQLQPEFLSSLAALCSGRETKFVESFRSSHILSLCSAFVDWRG